jgi:hypothetical protein
MRVPLVSMLAAVFLIGCCASHSASPRAGQATTTASARSRQSVAATTEPLPPQETKRLSARFPQLGPMLLAYRANEGDAHRGDDFAKLAMWVDISGRGNAKEIEVLSFLGLPDCGKRNGNYTGYIYYFRRAETKSKDVAMVTIDHGMLLYVGWNDASVNDYSKMKQFKKWSDVLDRDF